MALNSIDDDDDDDDDDRTTLNERAQVRANTTQVSQTEACHGTDSAASWSRSPMARIDQSRHRTQGLLILDLGRPKQGGGSWRQQLAGRAP